MLWVSSKHCSTMLGPKPEHVTTFLNPPHPASTVGLPQRKESDTTPTRESSSLDYLKAFILFCLKEKLKTWGATGFKIFRYTECGERNIQNLKTCGSEVCGWRAWAWGTPCHIARAQVPIGMVSPSTSEPFLQVPHYEGGSWSPSYWGP